ncbi:MAG: hypothetical protein NXI31_16595 [bacterium]|nr:hypothetical protein [bacterium]
MRAFACFAAGIVIALIGVTLGFALLDLEESLFVLVIVAILVHYWPILLGLLVTVLCVTIAVATRERPAVNRGRRRPSGAGYARVAGSITGADRACP